MFGGTNAAQPADNSQPTATNDTADPITGGMNIPDPTALSGEYESHQYDAGSTPPAVAADDNQASTSQDQPAQPPATSGSFNNPADGLLDIKQQALQQLTPLVGHLDQTPEEKFRTTMMMIQASDNADLIKEAYNAAQNISDEKARAQALLDIVNEINYFTQHHDASGQ